MLFKPEPDLETQPNRPKTLAISIGFHLLLLAVFLLEPDLFRSIPKRIIRIAGQEYDLDKTQLLTLAMPQPSPARPPAPADTRPMVQPPPSATPPPPQPQPQPQPQPPPPPPPNVITPEDVIADGARPDAQPKASRGNTEERARAGNSSSEPSVPAPVTPPLQPKPETSSGTTQSAQNTNPNALRSPTTPGGLFARAGQILDDNSGVSRPSAQGGRTGLSTALDNPNFSAEGDVAILSDTRGYDFGPYLNQVLNRVRVNWYSLIPEIARLGAKGRVVLVFRISQTGLIQDLRLVANSGKDPLDRAAQGSITASNPFQKLPAGFDGDHLDLQFTFLYNMK